MRKKLLPAPADSGKLRAPQPRLARSLLRLVGDAVQGGAYVKHDGPCGAPVTLARNRKVPFVSHLDSHHFPDWPRDGEPPLLSRRLGERARRTQTIADTRQSIVGAAGVPRLRARSRD